MMNEMDDRLAGDVVWELFSHPAVGPAPAIRARRYRRWLIAAGLIALGWFLSPPLGIVAVGLSVAAPDFHKARQLARSIPSKVGGTILDRISERVIADRPGKFGAKVPTVGKWNA
jgi:hypothetical protein